MELIEHSKFIYNLVTKVEKGMRSDMLRERKRKA